MPEPTLTLLIPTYNHADDLARTLEHFTRLDTSGLRVSFVVINNNATDRTAEVLAAFDDRLPLTALFEAKPGKNAALNTGLSAVELGELVVFTDDDVKPAPDWLQQIVAASARWPDYDVFGGKCFVVWPCDPVPAWARSEAILRWGFSSNEDIGETEGPYPEHRYPVGINYWIRRRVLAEDVRFDEAIGPVPENRIMGDETKFQMLLAARGHRILYAPRAVIGHCVQPAMVTPSGIRRRAYFIGRTGPNLKGPSQAGELFAQPWRWQLRRRISLLRYHLLYGLAWLSPNPDRRVARTVAAIRGIATNREMLRLAGLGHPLYRPPGAAGSEQEGGHQKDRRQGHQQDRDQVE